MEYIFFQLELEKEHIYQNNKNDVLILPLKMENTNCVFPSCLREDETVKDGELSSRDLQAGCECEHKDFLEDQLVASHEQDGNQSQCVWSAHDRQD